MKQLFTAPRSPYPPPAFPWEHRRHQQGPVAVIYSQRSSPDERPCKLAASSTGHVGKCLQWFPSKSGSLSSTTLTATGEPRQVVLGWVRLAAARWPTFSFPPGQDSSEGLNSACVLKRQEAFLCSTYANEKTPTSGHVFQNLTPWGSSSLAASLLFNRLESRETCGEQEPFTHPVCFGFQGCNHGRLVEELNSERRVVPCCCQTGRNYIDLPLSSRLS